MKRVAKTRKKTEGPFVSSKFKKKILAGSKGTVIIFNASNNQTSSYKQYELSMTRLKYDKH